MSSLKRIVCLANSWKHDERCIAGIDLDTKKWVRPICDRLHPEDGKVPESVRLINGKEPELLDILEIPLENSGQNFGFESENYSILPGNWQLLGKFQPQDLWTYCDNFPDILHNSSKYVNPSYLKSLPFSLRRTLQLIHTNNFSVKPSGKGWRASLQIDNGQKLRDAKITDPIFLDKLKVGYQPKENCFVTVSLSLPWPPHRDWEGEAPCWKLIAGVIEL